MEAALELLGLMPWEFKRLQPSELALLFRGHRRENNRMLRTIAWCLHVMVSPHVARNSRSSITPRRLVYGAPGYDPDVEDMT